MRAQRCLGWARAERIDQTGLFLHRLGCLLAKSPRVEGMQLDLADALDWDAIVP